MAKRKSQYDIYKQEYERAVGKKASSGAKPLHIILVLIVLAGIGFGAFQIMRHPEIAAAASEQISNVTDAATPDPVQLTPGEWISGTDFPAGRYQITTEDDRCMISGSGWVNTIHRGDDGYTLTLEKGDPLNCTDHVTLIPVR